MFNTVEGSLTCEDLARFHLSGKVVVNLASSDHIQAAVVLHPGRITDDEINGKDHVSHFPISNISNP